MSGAAAPGPERPLLGLEREAHRWLLPPDFYREREVAPANWVEAVLEPAALAILIALFVAGVVSFGLAVAPEWDARFVLPLSLLVALEGFFYGRRFARPALLIKEWAVLLAPAVLALRFLPYLGTAGDLLADAAAWWRDPGSFFTASFIVNLALLLLAWEMGLDATLELNRLRIQRGELISGEAAARHLDLYDDGWRRVDHGTPLRHLALRVLWGGVLLVGLAALAAIDVSQVMSPDALLQLVTFGRPAVSLAFANVTLYFVVGLLLLAEAQYVRQRTAWQLEHLSPPRSLPSRWIAEAALATLGVVGLALLLPTDYAAAVSRVFAALFAAVIAVAQVVAVVFFFLMMAILWPLHWLMPGGGDGEQAPPAQPPAIPPVSPAEPIPWLELLRSLAFWLVALVIVAYCLSVLWRRRPPTPAWPRAGLLGRLLSVLGSLFAALNRWGRIAASAVAAALPRLRPTPTTPARRALRWLALSRLSPAQLVEYFYLSVLERASKVGHARERGETPSEFSRRLPERLPDVEPELAELTVAFLEVRYGARPAEPALVHSARARWQRLKLKLRGRRLERLRRDGGPPPV